MHFLYKATIDSTYFILDSHYKKVAFKSNLNFRNYYNGVFLSKPDRDRRVHERPHKNDHQYDLLS